MMSGLKYRLRGHAIRRFRERFGIEIGHSGVRLIEQRILAGNAEFLRDQGKRTVYRLTWGDAFAFLAVIDNALGVCVTVLPEDAALTKGWTRSRLFPKPATATLAEIARFAAE